MHGADGAAITTPSVEYAGSGQTAILRGKTGSGIAVVEIYNIK